MLKSQNEGGGFGYTAELTLLGEKDRFSLKEGEITALRKKAGDLFDQVGQMIKRETKASDAQVVEFLDSRQGRHLADQMVGRSGLRTSSLPAKFKKDYWDWWAKEQGIRLSDDSSPDLVAGLRARHGVQFSDGAERGGA